MISLRRILCPVDFSESSKQALDYAVALSSWYESRLSVLHVCVELPVYQLASAAGPAIAPPIVLRDIDVDAQRAALRRFAASAVATVPTDVLVHEAVDARSEILAQAGALHADLLVMGTHGRSGFDHLLLGSVTEKVLRKAPCPVLVVPPHAGPARATAAAFKRIVCAVDFSDGSRRGLDYALDLAQEADARITLLHAIEFPPVLGDVALSTGVELDRMHAGVEAESLRGLRALVPAEARDYCTIATRVTDGKPHREIRQVAVDEQADLIVMGVQGRGAIDVMVFGSNTHAVIRSAPCPVLVVPAPKEAGRRLGEPVLAVGGEHVT
jgi:nucleotide-binding universal stress UspA family protein